MVAVRICLVLAFALAMATDAGKVLLIHLLFKSHIIELNILGETLARRGHDVYAALPDNSRFAAMFDDDSSAIKRLTFDAGGGQPIGGEATAAVTFKQALNDPAIIWQSIKDGNTALLVKC